MCQTDVMCFEGKKNKQKRTTTSPEKNESFTVIPDSSTKAESQLSPIRSLRAVTISVDVPAENCPD